jgi:hypothetical protein
MLAQNMVAQDMVRHTHRPTGYFLRKARMSWSSSAW